MKILSILGTTSTGKTDLALSLAKKFNGELVACDSRQVYVGLDIGTGKAPSGECKVQSVKLKVKKGKGYWEVNGIKVWMYDVVDPRKQYTVYDYVKDAKGVIEDIQKRGKLPIVVGGTGLYLKALIEGLPNLAIPIDKNLRKKLQKLSKEELQEKLRQISLDKWDSLNESDRQNPRRLIRAIEIVILSETRDITPSIYSSLIAQNDILKIGLIASRDILYDRIDERVIDRINQGMIDEAEDLHKSGLSFKRMRQLGLEYGVLADYLSGEIREIEGNQGLVQVLQSRIHGYARRQITWFKKEKDIFWFDIAGRDFPSDVEKMITKWYYQFVDVAKDRYFS